MSETNKVIRIFQSVVKDNIDNDNAAVYINAQQGVAYGGHRRSWGVGDSIVRYRGEIPTENIDSIPGVFHYASNSYIHMDGLPGKALPQGGRALLTPELCEDIFARTFEEVRGYHQLVINPKELLDFIENLTSRTGLGDAVLNIEPFEVANERGHFAARITEVNGELVAAFNGPHGLIPMYLESRGSLVDLNKLREGQWVVVAPIGVVEGNRFVRVISEYEPGIRIALQHFRAGLLMPGSPRYSVLAGEDNNDIREFETRTLKFIEGQDKINLRTAPMISIQLDTLVRVLEPMSEYKRVELLYKNSHTSILAVPFVAPGETIIESVFTPLSIYKSGKVLTV